MVKCEVCGEVMEGEDTLEHKEETGHNSWEMVVSDVEIIRHDISENEVKKVWGIGGNS